jgi:hypothetical protein
MNDLTHSESPQSDYIVQLREQFKRIDQIIEANGIVKLDLTENDRSISLIIDRNSVVQAGSPTRKTRSRSDNKILIAYATHNYSFDIDVINRQIRTDDIEAQIKASHQATHDRPKRKMRSSSRSLPNPAIKYIGNNWVLNEDCVYTTNDNFTITAKSGFETDLASIPRMFWPLVASFELSVTAPVFHDLIYRSAGEVTPPDGEVSPAGKIFTRLEADDIFLELMTRAKISYWIRNVAYLAVRSFAEHAWRKLRTE